MKLRTTLYPLMVMAVSTMFQPYVQAQYDGSDDGSDNGSDNGSDDGSGQGYDDGSSNGGKLHNMCKRVLALMAFFS